MNERDDMNLTPEERQIQDAIRGLGDVRADADFQARLRRDFISGDIAAAGPAVPQSGKVARWSWFAAPALAAGWLLAFTLSLDDLVIASFTSGTEAVRETSDRGSVQPSATRSRAGA